MHRPALSSPLCPRNINGPADLSCPIVQPRQVDGNECALGLATRSCGFTVHLKIVPLFRASSVRGTHATIPPPPSSDVTVDAFLSSKPRSMHVHMQVYPPWPSKLHVNTLLPHSKVCSAVNLHLASLLTRRTPAAEALVPARSARRSRSKCPIVVDPSGQYIPAEDLREIAAQA